MSLGNQTTGDNLFLKICLPKLYVPHSILIVQEFEFSRGLDAAKNSYSCARAAGVCSRQLGRHHNGARGGKGEKRGEGGEERTRGLIPNMGQIVKCMTITACL